MQVDLHGKRDYIIHLIINLFFQTTRGNVKIKFEAFDTEKSKTCKTKDYLMIDQLLKYKKVKYSTI